MKVGDGLGWPGHHLAHPAHPRYAPAQGQQQQEKGKPVFRVRPLLRSVAFWAFRPRPIAYYADNYADFWRRAK